MKIDVKINSLQLGEGNIKASAQILLDDCIEIRNVKVMNSKNGLFASMPAYQASDGKYYELCAPINKEARTAINKAVVDAYNRTIAQMQGQSQGQPQNRMQPPAQNQMQNPTQNPAQGQYGGNFDPTEQSFESAPCMSM